MRNVLFTLVLLSLAACGGETKEQHVARAKDFITAADYPAATLELHSALELDAASAEVHWLLGHVYLQSGNIAQAKFDLLQAQKLGWPDGDTRPAVAQALLAEGKVDEVLALESLDLNPPAAALLLSTQALAAISSDQLDRARVLVALALDKDPQLLQARLADARITLHEGDPNKAMMLVEAILESTPDSGVAWGIKGQSLSLLHRPEEARAAFDQSIAHSRIAFADRIARALINLQLQDYEAAQFDATQLLALSPNDAAANYIQGVLQFQKKQYRKALTALTLAEPASEQFPLVLYYLGMGFLVENDLQLAEKFGELFVRNVPDDSRGRKLLAAILLSQDKVGAAMDILQPALDYDPDDAEALNIMANALLLDNQVSAGLALYARITQLRPDWGFVPLRKEASLVTAVAGEEVSPPPAAMPDGKTNFPQAEVLSILNHLGKKDFDGAIEVAQSYQYRDFNSLAPYAVLGDVYVAAQQPAQAKEAYNKALKRDPWDTAANLGLAQLAQADNDPNSARRHYLTILKEHGDDLTTLMQLASLEAIAKNDPAMLSWLEQAATAHPHALPPRLKLAQYYLRSGRPDKVIPLVAKLLVLQQRSPEVLETTALAHLALQQYDDALAILQQLVAARPESANYYYLLATAASELGDVQRAKEALREVIKRDARHVPSLVTLARIAFNEGDRVLFEEYLVTLAKLAPQTPDVLRLQAQLAGARGNAVWAAILSQRAFAQTPTAQTMLELTAYQKAAGENETARKLLLTWINEHPDDIAVRLTLAGDLELVKDVAGANAQYLAVLSLQPDHSVALSRLAWNLRHSKPVQALQYIRKAVAKTPDQPELLDTLAVIESINGDHKSALYNIQRALAARPGDPSVRYHEALVSVARGDRAKAISSLEALAKNADAFPERAEAMVLLALLKG